MKKLVLTIAILAGASALYAQSSQDHINNTVKYEMSKLKTYNLTAAQETALTKFNKEAAEAMHKLGPSSADVNAFKKIADAKEAEYKKVMTKEQFNKWKNDPNK